MLRDSNGASRGRFLRSPSPTKVSILAPFPKKEGAGGDVDSWVGFRVPAENLDPPALPCQVYNYYSLRNRKKINIKHKK